MTNKQIKKLALQSYTKNNLDSKKINKIIKLFTRREFKLYLKAIKLLEKNKTVFVITPMTTKNNTFIMDVKKSFPNKKIITKTDNSLIAGIKVINSDDVYDFNIKNTLENLISYVRN